MIDSKKERGRIITGWRQVVRPDTGPARKRPAPAAKAVPPQVQQVSLPAAKEEWENEGGNLKNVVKVAK